MVVFYAGGRRFARTAEAEIKPRPFLSDEVKIVVYEMSDAVGSGYEDSPVRFRFGPFVRDVVLFVIGASAAGYALRACVSLFGP